ncbi:hypothetical protein THAOC_32573 [Thalassiosira oceanica]|uniref:Uncharacterized protein n=1 Tax=Thalassiosira oceanica TaxID=159749 RepID=K0RPH5_THAOC|nr:hypothetical protein THAOC_32573 [Thalassiosira oceanica]|eukprot:EJK48617.1 hypothetical protein THAOC_32573 [Thalassiosira oceanica]
MATVARPRPLNGETLHERSKGKDVRISNIVAAKVHPKKHGTRWEQPGARDGIGGPRAAEPAVVQSQSQQSGTGRGKEGVCGDGIFGVRAARSVRGDLSDLPSSPSRRSSASSEFSAAALLSCKWPSPTRPDVPRTPRHGQADAAPARRCPNLERKCHDPLQDERTAPAAEPHGRELEQRHPRPDIRGRAGDQLFELRVGSRRDEVTGESSIRKGAAVTSAGVAKEWRRGTRWRRGGRREGGTPVRRIMHRRKWLGAELLRIYLLDDPEEAAVPAASNAQTGFSDDIDAEDAGRHGGIEKTKNSPPFVGQRWFFSVMESAGEVLVLASVCSSVGRVRQSSRCKTAGVGVL